MSVTARIRCSVALATTLIGPAAAMATTMSWTYQQILPPGGNPYANMALTMRTGATWPTLFHSVNADLRATQLTPVGWTSSTVGDAIDTNSVRATAGADGRVGAVWATNQTLYFTQSSALGWQTSAVGAETMSLPRALGVDYLSGNRPIVSYSSYPSNEVHIAANDGVGWQSDVVLDDGGVPVDSALTSLAVGSQDQIAVAYASPSTVGLSMRDPIWAEWSSVSIPYSSGPVQDITLSYGPNDRPGLAVLDTSGVITYAWFDIQAGAWTSEIVEAECSSQRIHLALDSLGNPSLAYVGTSTGTDAIHYRHKTSGSWLDAALPLGTDPGSGLNRDPDGQTEAALAFDAADVPLISYLNGNGEMLLAYDPVVPEPASLLVAAGGLSLVARRRRRV
jgi:hypothetical protein